MPLRRWFCAAGACPSVVDDVVYRDDHVTATSVERYLRPLGDALLARSE